MEKTVKILLFESLAGNGFAFGKGENDVPEKIAADLVKARLAEYVGTAKKSSLEGAKGVETAETRPSPAAKKSEKR